MDANCVNDPFAGSPTKTLLRLLVLLDDMVQTASDNDTIDIVGRYHPKFSPDHPLVQATGGEYKGQGRNQREMMTRAY